MFKAITDFFGGGVVKAADGLVKTIWGSAEQRESDAHKEQMSVMNAFAAEFMPRENRTWWDSFVDGLNRLPRPTMTFGIIALFWYCIAYPVEFGKAMASLALMPGEGWAAIITVIGFWFGGKFLGKDARRPKMPTPEEMSATLDAIERMDDIKRKRENTPQG